MPLNKILAIVFAVTSVIMGYLLYESIMEPIREQRRIKKIEADIIDKLKLIREGEKMFMEKYKRYTANWDSLGNFMKNGKVPIIERSERVITLPWGADSVVVNFDTISYINVYDSIFSKPQFENYDFNRLEKIPHADGEEFEIYADRVVKGPNLTVDVIEVKDITPENPKREEGSQYDKMKPLRFGSRNDVTLAGNWE